jgi:eukaryotic-like serine/threonine-protein kinase
LRGQALLQKGLAAAAVREFDKVLQNRGVDPFAPVVPLAQLGLARARARDGDAAGSRKAYDDVFRIWRAADADFVPLIDARAEYGRLAASTPTPPAAH